MSAKVIKFGKKDDIGEAIRQIKQVRERELLFEIAGGSPLLRSSDNLKLMKKAGEVLGKKILVATDDEVGRVLAKKAGVLSDDAEVTMPKVSRVARSDIKPRFSDIMIPKSVINKISLKPAKNIVEKLNPAAIFAKGNSEKSPSGKKRSLSSFTKYVIIAALILIIIIFAGAIFLPKATVTVEARSEPITRDLEIAVDKNTASISTSQLAIGGLPFTKEVSLTKTFPTTGTSVLSGTKSAGQVTLYNFTPNTLTLKASTTTLVANGKKYSFTQDIKGIKPTTKNGTAINTASLIAPVAIVAQVPGEESNIAPGTNFQIVNSALGNKNVYAINQVAITGGSASTSTVLSQQDLDNAVDSLTNDMLLQIESELSTTYATTVKIIPTGINKEFLAKTANKSVGDAVNSFDMTVIERITGLAFKDDEVTKVVIAKINEVLSSDKYLLDNGKKEYTAKFKSLDLQNGKGVLSVHFETVAAYKVNNDNLTKILAGKNEAEIKEILLSKPEVDNVDVKFWPAWMVNKAPRINGKIYINTVLSQ